MNAIAASAGLQRILDGDPWEGQICAVFRRSLLCSDQRERLIHLHIGPRLVSPFSLRLEDNFLSLLQATPFVRGMPLRKTDSTIEIAECMQLQLNAVTYYRSPPPLIKKPDSSALKIAWQMLRAHGRPGGFESLPRSQALVNVMQRGLADGSAAQTLEAARHLIGLGPGLTPSGDDFLVGCLRVLWLMSRKMPWVYQMLENLRHALLPDLDVSTTRVSAEFIRYALRGAFAEVVDQAAFALLPPSQPWLVCSAVSHLLSQGETSGTDTTRGLLTCLEALFSMSEGGSRHEWHDTPATPSISTAAQG
jgi:Protein of unknown function (DUF2877)